jgi:hypothetical protein
MKISPYLYNKDFLMYSAVMEIRLYFRDKSGFFVLVVPPRINGSQFQEKSVVINQQLILNCDAAGIPPPKMVWMRRNQIIPSYGNPSVRIRDQGRQLLLTNAQLLDEGDYTCLVTNPAGNTSLDFSVSVQGNTAS